MIESVHFQPVIIHKSIDSLAMQNENKVLCVWCVCAHVSAKHVNTKRMNLELMRNCQLFTFVNQMLCVPYISENFLTNAESMRDVGGTININYWPATFGNEIKCLYIERRYLYHAQTQCSTTFVQISY